MRFDLAASIAVLERTPAALDALLRGLPDGWTSPNEGPDTWSPYDIVGHLIHGERTDWMPRLRIILDHGEAQPFTPFDRFAQFEASRGQTLPELLDTFAELRVANLEALRALALTDADFDRPGTHPELGGVTLGQLLATWTVHDLGHLGQIARVMAKQYASEVGVWRDYLTVLGDRTGP